MPVTCCTLVYAQNYRIHGYYESSENFSERNGLSHTKNNYPFRDSHKQATGTDVSKDIAIHTIVSKEVFTDPLSFLWT